MIAPVSLLSLYGTSALNGLFLCATKVYRAAQCRAAAAVVLSMLGLLWCCNASIPLMAQESQQRPVKDHERETWRKAMVRTPLPKKGCFQVSYPNKEWKEIACSNAKVVPPQLRRKGNHNPTVGAGSGDWTAVSAGTITTAEGSFLSTNGVTSESDGTYGANQFSLQMNTNFFQNTTTTSLCTGATTPALCQGWVQFVIQQFPPPYCAACGAIWYFLFQYGTATCPSGWSSDGVGDWYQHSGFMPLTAATISNLGLMTVTGQASGGTDTATIYNGSGTLTATNSDSLLDLEASWNTAEFNVFGSGGGSVANFNANSTIDVEIAITDGTTNAPTCSNQSFTAETSNLNLANVTGSTTQLVCCSYGGSPRIQFMETNATPAHTATCGPTRIEGDPHITTADGVHYDFQAAGEFISLRDDDGAEIQTRQMPIATTSLGTDSHDGLSTCVSLNSAVAARVGDHRVTYEPNLSGVPDPSGLQLRIDGALTTLGPSGINLGGGGHVAQLASTGILEVDFPDGKTLFVTPQFWTTYGKWFLNVDVSNAGLISSDGGGARLQGIAGPIPNGSWLPALPSGASMGAMPSALPQRYSDLYHKFAEAWRVTKKDSLFDYAPGTSTDTFTDKNWPSEKSPCVVSDTKPVQPIGLEIARAACRRVADPDRRADCTFDVQITGNIGFATSYLYTQRILKDATSTNLTDDPQASQLGELVAFTAFVAANGPESTGHPSGTVQFRVDGKNVGAPVLLDARGRATWETTALKVGKHEIAASYEPEGGSAFLPSSSTEKVHIVKRCPCGDRK